MKRRGLRVTLTAGAIGLAVVAGVVACNWGVVRDHAEAWWFQATRETETVRKANPLQRVYVVGTFRRVRRLSAGEALRQLACVAAQPVVYDPVIVRAVLKVDWFAMSLEAVLRTFRENGYRIVEQCFPRRAYVVVGYPEVKFSEIPLGGPLKNTH